MQHPAIYPNFVKCTIEIPGPEFEDTISKKVKGNSEMMSRKTWKTCKISFVHTMTKLST